MCFFFNDEILNLAFANIWYCTLRCLHLQKHRFIDLSDLWRFSNSSDNRIARRNNTILKCDMYSYIYYRFTIDVYLFAKKTYSFRRIYQKQIQIKLVSHYFAAYRLIIWLKCWIYFNAPDDIDVMDLVN